MIIHQLQESGKINPPKWLITNTHFLSVAGSVAYGVSSDSSDVDVFGFAIPKKSEVFPHTAGEIPNFGPPKKRFEQWQQYGVQDVNGLTGEKTKYDFTIFGIVKLFNLAMQNNPNIIDSLFVPDRFIMHSTQVGNLVRLNRKVFLSKRCYERYKGYAYSQLKKVQVSSNAPDLMEVLGFEQANNIPHSVKFEDVEREISNRIEGKERSKTLAHLSGKTIAKYYDVYHKGMAKSKRFEDRKIFGYETKLVYHIVRLMLHCKQLLTDRDIKFEENKTVLREIRSGERKFNTLRYWFSEEEKVLDRTFYRSTLPLDVNEEEVKSLLIKCLEIQYGSLSNCLKLRKTVK